MITVMLKKDCEILCGKCLPWAWVFQHRRSQTPLLERGTANENNNLDMMRLIMIQLMLCNGKTVRGIHAGLSLITASCTNIYKSSLFKINKHDRSCFHCINSRYVRRLIQRCKPKDSPPPF